MRDWLNRQTDSKRRPDFVFILCLALAVLLPSIGLASGYIFSGDAARDLLDLYTAYIHHTLPLIGPSASVGGFHVGPLFYYLLLPPLIISGFDPIMPVLVAVLINVLTVAMGYKLLKDFATRRAAVYFGILAVLSPYLIHLARGSWNPNPQPLVALVLLYALMKLIERPTFRYMLVLGLTIGCGVQLHYTFLSNAITSFLIILVFRPRLLIDWRLYLAGGLGLALPLIPFAIGQAQNNLEDIRGLVHYMRKGQTNFADVVNPALFIKHVMSPFLSFFGPLGSGKVAVVFPVVLWSFVLLLVSLSARAKPVHKLAGVALLFYGLGALQIHTKNLIHPYYHLFYSIVVLVLVALALDYLTKKRAWAGIGLCVAFLLWEAATLPATYRVDRTASAVSRAADLVYTDAAKNPARSGPLTRVYLESTISSWEAFEYRFFLERKGLRTGFAFADEAHYLIIESKTPSQSRDIPGYDQVTVMRTADASQLVKSIAVYRRSVSSSRP
jgi:hypothetical protein